LSFFNELKRRNVFKVAIAYIVMAWLIMQVADVILNNITAPDWVFHVLLLFIAVGLPFALFFAWAFELTPDGLKRESEVDRSQSITHETSKKLNHIITGVLVLALGYFAYDKFVLSGSRENAAIETAVEQAVAKAANAQSATVTDTSTPADTVASARKTIAVLPFADMSADKDQEYLSDGISEELLNLLAKIPELKVTSRTSAFSYKGKEVRISDVGRELDVAHVLEGSVRKAGNQVRITAQLIEVAGDTHLWSQTYDRNLDNIFAIQDEIASEVVAQLKLTLLGAAPTTQETDPQAYALFLQARHMQRLGTVGSQEQAIALFKQALEIAPAYPAAWTGLSFTYGDQAIAGQLGLVEGLQLSSDAANMALRHDPDFALAHASLGQLALMKNDTVEAAARYTRALELSPANPDILRNCASFFWTVGRLDENIAIQEYLVGLDPVDAGLHNSLGRAYLMAGRWEQAIQSLNTSLTLSPGRTAANYQVGLALLALGSPQAALAAMEKELGDEEFRIKGMALALHDLGRQAEFEETFARLREGWGEQWPSEIAQVYAWTGDADSAFEWLDRSISQNEDGLASQFIIPLYQPIHSDPRWMEFREKSGASEEQLAAIEFKVILPE